MNLTQKEIWQNFFKNIKYDIGGLHFSFEDILYIIFHKNIFYQNDKYIPRDYVQKYAIDLSKDDTFKEVINPLLLFLPNKEFFSPIIYDENNIESDIEKRYSNYYFCFIRWDENNEIIYLNQLILLFEPDFFKKIKEYESFIDRSIYKVIKHKKYKKKVIIPFKWEMSFDYLLEEAFLES